MEATTSKERNQRRRNRRSRTIQNVKDGGDLIMYIGSTALMIPHIRKAQETQNGIMAACATCAGAVISIGVGRLACKAFERTVDKIASFWDDVKPKKEKEEPEENEDSEDEESE